MNDKERNSILSQDGLEFFGDGKPVDMERLEEELQMCRQTGYAVDPGETNPNITAVSSPIFTRNGDILGAVVLVGAFPRAKIKLVGPKVVAATRIISRKLGYTVFPATR